MSWAFIIKDSILRMNPARLIGNPVMFVVELSFFVVLLMAIVPGAFPHLAHQSSRMFYADVAAILLITVWFSTVSDSFAEARSRVTTASLKKLEKEGIAKRIKEDEGSGRTIESVKSSELRKGDVILIEKGDQVPIDAEVTEGIAKVDESLLTGESAGVKKSKGDTVIGGSTVISDSIDAIVNVNPDETYISKLVKMVESSERPKTPNELALSILLIGLTGVFTIILISLIAFSLLLNLGADLSVLIALYVCLLPTTIGALLPAIGISGITRMSKNNIIAKSGKAIETAGDADTILLDKTGTITVGNRLAYEFIPLGTHTERELAEAAFLSSWNDDTPEGKSILELAYKKKFVPREYDALREGVQEEFSAVTRKSGITLTDADDFTLLKGGRDILQRHRFRRKFELQTPMTQETTIQKGAPESIKESAKICPDGYDDVVTRITSEGGTPISVSMDGDILGIIYFKDVIKRGIKEKILGLKTMGIRPVMITGDHPLTAKNIAGEVGIEDYVAQAKPETKYQKVKDEQAENRIVAMIGDGTNDAPALAAADVGLAMASGTLAAKDAANMVDLESNPSKIIDVVMLGKQLLMTRGTITTFSITNDVAKYFAIVPIMFASIPALGALNILGLSPHIAVLSALIFNAAVIPALIPLALRGTTFKPQSTLKLFLKNLVIYGGGGVLLPFAGIKLIAIVLVFLGGVI
ncbi:potassium-transporting ATPase subunit KdpB [Ferroplasma acidiphilum]|uniref:Potassium-transporting ATPase ATP-binding subunit n=2 Tax=Ferroplasma acidiphilum TaxID=74969 RepID=A0A7K4FMM3_9ARCH|nr:potassium-transporting ATPase subunit KdpB [Ferroplasma acidiphilum]